MLTVVRHAKLLCLPREDFAHGTDFLEVYAFPNLEPSDRAEDDHINSEHNDVVLNLCILRTSFVYLFVGPWVIFYSFDVASGLALVSF